MTGAPGAPRLSLAWSDRDVASPPSVRCLFRGRPFSFDVCPEAPYHTNMIPIAVVKELDGLFLTVPTRIFVGAPVLHVGDLNTPKHCNRRLVKTHIESDVG